MPKKPKVPTQAAIIDALQKVFPRLRCIEDRTNTYHLPTIYGTLWIHPYDGAIRTCFQLVPEVEPFGAPLNKFSGKWNFEGVVDDDALLWAIGKILNIAVEGSP